MKKIITIILICLSVYCYGQTQSKQLFQKPDTSKKYIITLTENEYQALAQKLQEAAEYEALQQKDKTLKQFGEFLKANTQPIKKEEIKK